MISSFQPQAAGRRRIPEPRRPAASGGDPTRGARRRLGRARELAEELALRTGIAATRRLDHGEALRLGAQLGALYGAAARRLATRPHRLVQANLARALPDRAPAERDAIAAAMWRNWGRTLAETGRLATLDPAALRALVHLEPAGGPREIFAHAERTGALVLTAHFGSFELLHAACAAYGHPIMVVHRTLANRRVDRWLTVLRERAGTHLVRTGSAARSILRALRAGGVVAVPFDQRPHDATHAMVPFFGFPAATSTGLARLALAANAPVFPVVLVRDGESARHRALFLPALTLPRSGDREQDVLAATGIFNATLERLIRAHPEQWIWMYNRWKPHRRGRDDGASAPARGGAAAAIGERSVVGARPPLSADRTP